jgi:RNA polymerase sigma-70 factor (ECF subfamily)
MCQAELPNRDDSRGASFTVADRLADRPSLTGGNQAMRATLCDNAGSHAPQAALDEAAQIALARRDPRAFAPLYEHYADPVYRYCHRRLGDPDAAADATSKVFVRALAALPRYQHASFRSWLFAIAHNTLVDGWRTARIVAPLVAGTEHADPAPSPEDQILSEDAGREVRALLARLPADQRHVVEMRLAGLSNQEIADALGRSVGATKMLHVRALTTLRALLQPETITGSGEGP